MNPSNVVGHFSTDALYLQKAEIPIEELVSQTYDSAPLDMRSQMLSQLVTKVYEGAPATLQSSLLEQLLRPLGVLSLVAVASGIFAKIRFRSGWPDLHVRLEDAQSVRASDLVALVDYVQQVSFEALDGLSQLLITSPYMATSAAAAVLVTVIASLARTRRAGDIGLGNWTAKSN